MKKSEELKTKANAMARESANMLALAAKYEALEKEEDGISRAATAPKPLIPLNPPKKTVPMHVAPQTKPARKSEPVPMRKIEKAALNERILKAMPAEGAVKATDVADAVGEHKYWVSQSLKELAVNGVVIKSGNRRGTVYQIKTA